MSIDIIRKYSVYQLEDPRDNLPFYVGYTFDMERRYIEHIRGDSTNFAKADRIVELQQLGLQPVMREIESVEGTVSDAMQRESYWIRRLGSEGMPLVNNYPLNNIVRVNRGYNLREDLVLDCKRIALEEGRKLYEVMEEAFSQYIECRKKEV